MRRREFVTLLGGAAAWPLAARAQQPAIPVIGLLSPESATTGNVNGLHEGLRELGYVEGRDIRFEYRWAEGRYEQLPDFAAELVRLKVDVIVAFVTQAALSAKSATGTIPIVMVGVGDPVESGLIASLAHPGGNVTGTSSLSAEIVGKQFQLLKEITPNASRFTAIWNPANPVWQALQLKHAKAAARALGIELQILEAKTPNEFDAAFETIDREGIRALVILLDPVYMTHYRSLVGLSLKRRLIATMAFRAFADAGGLMSYGTNFADQYKHAAVYVDKILKGAKPAGLPVEQATKFELVINLKTARTIGIEIPTSVLLLANEVIE
jgi:putative tryptophan/tyrosine transport system substrate-binding protein